MASIIPALARSFARLVASGPAYAPPEPAPLANTFGDPCATAVQVGSPTLPTGIRSAKTLGEPPLKGAVCTQQHTGQAQGFKCGVFRCPRPLTLLLFANTVKNACPLNGGEQCVLSRSPFLAIAGI